MLTHFVAPCSRNLTLQRIGSARVRRSGERVLRNHAKGWLRVWAVKERRQPGPSVQSVVRSACTHHGARKEHADILSVPAGLDPTPDSNAQERAEGPRRKGPHHRGARPSTPPYGSLPLRNVDAPLNSFQLSNVHDVAPRSQSAGRAFHVEGMRHGPGAGYST